MFRYYKKRLSCGCYCTLEYLIAEHARLTILNIFSTLLALNRSGSLNYFEHIFHPAPLIVLELLPFTCLFLPNVLIDNTYSANFCTLSQFEITYNYYKSYPAP